MILKTKQNFPIKGSCLLPFSLLFLYIIMIEIIDTTMRIKIAAIKIQNRIMVGVFSKNIASLYLYFRYFNCNVSKKGFNLFNRTTCEFIIHHKNTRGCNCFVFTNCISLITSYNSCATGSSAFASTSITIVSNIVLPFFCFTGFERIMLAASIDSNCSKPNCFVNERG